MPKPDHDRNTNSDTPDRASRILDAAAELIAHYGYDKTSVEDIAKAAGISKGAIYLHFESKESLFDAVLIRESSTLLDIVIERVQNDPRGLTLFTLYTHAITAAFSNPLLKALYTEDRRILGDFVRRARSSPLLQRGMVFGTDFVRGFQESGLIRRDFPPDVIAYVLLIVRFGLFTIDDYIPAEQAPRIELVASAIAAMFDSGLAVHGPPGHQDKSVQVLTDLLNYGREAFRQMRESSEGSESKKRGKGSGT